MRKVTTAVGAAVSALAFGLFPIAPAGAATTDVTISKSGCSPHTYCYKPPSVTVANGSTVRWTDTSGVKHDVTRCNTVDCNGTGPGTGTDSTFTDGDVTANGTFSHAFHGAGSYNYFCTIHGFAAMHGTVVVSAPK
jgi:plastocyanin